MDMARLGCIYEYLIQLIARRNLTNVSFFFHTDFAPPQSVAIPCQDNSASLGKNQLHRSQGAEAFLLACGGGYRHSLHDFLVISTRVLLYFLASQFFVKIAGKI
jgi:hypothetical protein